MVKYPVVISYTSIAGSPLEGVKDAVTLGVVLLTGSLFSDLNVVDGNSFVIVKSPLSWANVL